MIRLGRIFRDSIPKAKLKVLESVGQEIEFDVAYVSTLKYLLDLHRLQYQLYKINTYWMTVSRVFLNVEPIRKSRSRLFAQFRMKAALSRGRLRQ